MRKLLNTLYVTSEDVYLKLDGENIVIQKEKDIIGRFPLHNLEGICCFSYAGASPMLMGACTERDIELSFFTPHGRYLASAIGEMRGNVLLRREQYRRAENAQARALIARNMLIGKVFNCRWVLERATRDHPQRVNVEKLKSICKMLAGEIHQMESTTDTELLRGFEGSAAQQYFRALGSLVLQNEKIFAFTERSRRPPLDPFNAMLSFAYSLLSRDCASALSGVGLDPYVGYLHTARPGRQSLALDLMEELRALAADRFVLTLINNRMIKPTDFERRPHGAVVLKDHARKTFLSEWQTRKKETITHPYLKEKIEWGLVPHVQALLLARHLRGDLDAYPAFLWK